MLFTHPGHLTRPPCGKSKNLSLIKYMKIVPNNIHCKIYMQIGLESHTLDITYQSSQKITVGKWDDSFRQLHLIQYDYY